MLGYWVDNSTINQFAGQTALNIRQAFSQVETMNEFLTAHPVVSGTDPLVTQYQFTAEEAQALRLYFQNMDGLRTGNQTTFDVGRKMTGLM